MEEIDLNEEFQHLAQEIKVGSVAEHDLGVTEFFRIYAALAAENGDTPDLEYSPVLFQGPPKHRVDGYALDLIEGEGSESGDLYLVVCDYSQDDQMPSLNAKHVDQSVDLAERFFKRIHDSDYLDSLEETDDEYQLAVLIRQYYDRISRVRIVIFSNGHLKTRKNVFETRQVADKTLHINVLDLERYSKISASGNEPIEVDFAGDFGGGLESLSPSTGTDNYSAYLFAIPGPILAEVFAVYGNRLLEQNVRTFLQARTNVNKGILKTIAEEPGMFFAYNNGITATASEVTMVGLGDGRQAISAIKNFQIVNGGQTTASLLYARDSLKRDLSHVHVQVKLSVIEEESLETVVPRISEYANTQNKVSLADLASNSPAQIQIERLSREVMPPQKAGYLHSVKWFYERSRGQYRSLFAYKTPSERKKLELEYPKSHLVIKTDLAKYEYSFDGRPHVVSMGAQKCFLKFTDDLTKMASGGGAALNAVWYQRAIAKAILFKALDAAVQMSEWYKEDRGYKAQIVTYAVAACADGFRRAGHQINLDMVWDRQEMPAQLLTWMLKEAKTVASLLKNPPPEVRNISEYAKKAGCWETGVAGRVGIPSDKLLEDYGVSLADYQAVHAAGRQEEKRHKELDLDLAIIQLAPRASEIRGMIEAGGIASPKNMSAIRKLESGNVNLNKGEKNALKTALERLEIEF
jgi:hypothetical protein